MKKLIFTLLALAVGLTTFAQSTLRGTIVDQESNEALIGASVLLSGTSTGTVTDIDGNFELTTDETTGTLEISYTGYESMRMDFNGSQTFGTISMGVNAYGLGEVVVTGVMDIVKDRRTPVAVSTITVAEIQAKGVGNVEFPEVMKNTPSVYVSNQTGFGDSQMFMRGFGQVNTAFLLNGQPINGMEDGRMYWSNWSGMSDVASAVQIQRGLGSSRLAISSVGGTVNIVTKTTDNEEGGFVRAMVGNDAYLKGTVSYSSGMKGKWAYSFLLDHWQADNKWAEGTRGQGQNYFVSVGYQPNSRNNFNFLITGAPQSHGQRWSQSEETLEENPKFNQHWGEYEGEFMTERLNFYHKPVINLNWDFQINSNSSLASVLYASFGRGGGTGPYGSSRNRIRYDGGELDGQIDFDAIESANLADSDGIGTFSDNYARRASMNNHQWFGNVTSYKTKLGQDFNFSVGADFRWYTGDHFRQLVNLYGLNSWNESFRHATRPSDYQVTETFKANPWSALFNFADEDQRIAYDYSEDINYQGVFSQLEYVQPNFTAFVQAALSNQSYQREGRWSDIGQSDKINKVGYNVKGGASVTANVNSTFFVNAGYYSRQPFLDNVFENIRYSNDFITPEVENEDVIGLELGYKYFKDNFSANINLYSTSWGNRTRVFTFNNDNGTPDNEDDDFAQRNVEQGIKQIHRGVELDLEYRLNALTLRGYASFGNWELDEIREVDAFNDDTGLLITTETGEDVSGVHVPNAPQTSLGAGVFYRAKNGLSFSTDINYFDRIYRRDDFASRNDVILREDIGTLDAYILVDAGVGYSFKVGEKDLTLRANVYNLLDNDYINQTDPFGVLNGNGLTWNFSAKYSF